MNAHTEITHDLAFALGVFWRKGRQQFVPLTSHELDALGVMARDRAELKRTGLLSSETLSRGERFNVWSVTEAGAAAMSSPGALVPVASSPPEPKAKVADWRAKMAGEKRRAKFVMLLAALQAGPLSNRALAAAIGRSLSVASYGVTALVEAGLAERRHTLGHGGRIGGDWTVITITDAGREWLAQAQNGGAQ